MPEFVPSGMTRFPRLWSALAGLVLGFLLRALGWQWLGTPVILVRGVPQLGFNPERLRLALQPPA